MERVLKQKGNICRQRVFGTSSDGVSFRATPCHLSLWHGQYIHAVLGSRIELFLGDMSLHFLQRALVNLCVQKYV